MTDEALMAAYQKGDVAAFSELLERHEKRLWNFLRRFVRDKATAEDLLQEVFLRVVKSAAQWQPSAKVSTWLFTIARNLCTDQARRAEFRQAESLDQAKAGEGDSGLRRIDRIAALSGNAETEAMGHEIASLVDRAVDELPVDQREVFLMREVMDMSFAEIAAQVGASEPTVKSRMRYALQRLRSMLGELHEATGAGSASAEGTP
ncbi:MAG: RNA polymerase sigma factor [Polyangia bacterium]|jgi:RNA polymerase sigma-70 factor (ECF subfamily)